MEKTWNLRSRRALRPLALLGLGLCIASPSFAQPGANDGGGGNGGGGRGNRRGGMNGGGQRFDMSLMREQMVRRMLERAGYTDVTLVNAIVAYMKAKDAARQPLNEAASSLTQKLSSDEINDDQIAVAWDSFQAALDAEKKRNETAEAALDAQIKFSADKRLTAVLTLAGVIGDASAYVTQQGGRGMRGGFGGGPNGGGRGGGPNGGPGGGQDDAGGPPPPPPGDN